MSISTNISNSKIVYYENIHPQKSTYMYRNCKMQINYNYKLYYSYWKLICYFNCNASIDMLLSFFIVNVNAS